MVYKELVLKHIKENAEYFPFEYIRGYKRLLSMEKQIPLPNETKEEYFALFKCAKEQCEHLLKKDPKNADADLWREAIDEINKIIN